MAVLEQALPLGARLRKSMFRKTVIFDGGAGSGAVGTIPIATCEGRVIVDIGSVYCPVSLVGATATIEMGVTGNTGGFIVQTVATNINAGNFWQDATPEVGVGGRLTRGLAGNLFLTIGTAAITAGQLEIRFPWYSAAAEGRLF